MHPIFPRYLPAGTLVESTSLPGNSIPLSSPSIIITIFVNGLQCNVKCPLYTIIVVVVVFEPSWRFKNNLYDPSIIHVSMTFYDPPSPSSDPERLAGTTRFSYFCVQVGNILYRRYSVERASYHVFRYIKNSNEKSLSLTRG